MRTQKSEFLSERVQYIPTRDIRPNSQQPRRQFDPQGLQELADSIQLYGILQPLTVQKRGSWYELIAGERRLRAARLAGLSQVPCIIARVGEEEAGMLALIENLQRRDLHYMEEAQAIAKMVIRYHLTQEQVAQKLGKSQSAVANKLRLLRLGEAVTERLAQYDLTERHARALLRLSDPEQQIAAAETMGKKGMNVAQAEEYVEKLLHTLQKESHNRRKTFILKDVRLFLNSVQHQVNMIHQSGIPAEMTRRDDEDRIVLTICIPKHGEKVPVEK